MRDILSKFCFEHTSQQSGAVGRKQITWPWNFVVDDNMQFYCFDSRLSFACLIFILSEKETIRMNWDGKNYYRRSMNKKVALLSTTNNDQAVVWN